MARNALKYVQVDAFTRTAFKGNPAAVFVLPRMLPDGDMQNIAAELNLSETAFVCREENEWRLRWFTPTVEVDLCGHATLASAHVLWTEGHMGHNDPILFRTRSGSLDVRKRADHICMNFPVHDVTEMTDAPAELKTWRGVTFVGLGSDVLVELESEALVQNFQPDFAMINRLPGDTLIITAKSSQPFRDFVSRVFAPKFGLPEDPVTGSAHCVLGPYWMKKLGKASVQGEQLSRRTGVVHVAATDDPARVVISGQAVTMLKGIFLSV